MLKSKKGEDDESLPVRPACPAGRQAGGTLLDENDKDASRTHNFIKSAAGRWFTVFISFINSMKAAELRTKSAIELKSLLVDKALRAEELVLLLRQKKAKNVKELREVKRDIARIKTVLNEAKI